MTKKKTIREVCRKVVELNKEWGPLAPFFDGNLDFSLWRVAKRQDVFGEIARGLELLSKRGKRIVFDVAWEARPVPSKGKPQPEPSIGSPSPGPGTIVRHRHGWEPVEGTYLGNRDFRGKDGELYEIDARHDFKARGN